MASKDVHLAKMQSDPNRRSQHNSEKLRQDMTVTRQSISKHLNRMEELMSQRIRDTTDHLSVQVIQTADILSQRIKETTDYVSKGIRDPIHELQNKLDVPVKVRSDPLRSVGIAAASGLIMGMWMARRASRQARIIRRELQASLPRDVLRREAPQPASGAIQGALIGLGTQVAQQLIHIGIARLAESLPPPGRASSSQDSDPDHQIKHHGASSSLRN